MNSASLFNLVLFGSLVWMVYMMTFRTQDWLNIERANRERNEQMMNGLGRATKGGL